MKRGYIRKFFGIDSKVRLAILLIILISIAGFLVVNSVDFESESVVVKDSSIDTDSQVVKVSLESSKEILSSGERFIVKLELIEETETMIYNPATKTAMPTIITEVVSTESKDIFIYRNEVKNLEFEYEKDNVDDYRVSVEEVE